MANDKNQYNSQFDSRLNIMISNNGNNDLSSRIPISGQSSSPIVDSLYMGEDTLQQKQNALTSGSNAMSTDAYNKLAQNLKAARTSAKNINNLKSVPAIINPYATIRLVGNGDDVTKRLIDSSNRRPWYEENISNSTDSYGYSKYPTTSAIIEWGKTDSQYKTPYQFQDFVFCKWWNKIPNNRLITLRRYAMPILDNLSTPADDETMSEKFPPIATAITYFGEETGNSLKDILKFSTGLNWGDTSANVWDVTGDDVATNTNMEGIGDALHLTTLFKYGGHALNALSIVNGDFLSAGLEEANGLPPDPYENGPYENRIKGPVNRIDSVKRREAGLKFEMSGLKIKFDYVGRPIGGINSKAVLLDILSNFMLMGSASAVFFGGQHRFRVKGVRFPAFNTDIMKRWYSGDLEGGITSMMDNFANTIGNIKGNSSFLNAVMDIGKGLWSDLMNLIGNPLGYKPEGAKTEQGRTIGENLKNALTQKIHTGMKVPYLTGMRALLTGEPVGEWHLTIGNPMNPIAMIGNLICTNIEVEFDEDAGLGPDDFPLGFSVTVSLDHGMPRDRDAIESMFNKGSGRIYEVPKSFIGSADKQTSVDEGSKSNEMHNGKDYVTTETSQQGRVLDVPNSTSKEIISRTNTSIFDTESVTSLSSKNTNISATRIPTIASIDWIIKKGLN